MQLVHFPFFINTSSISQQVFDVSFGELKPFFTH
jgi:hypothetical protein